MDGRKAAATPAGWTGTTRRSAGQAPTPSSSSQDVLPTIPDELLAALSRDPPETTRPPSRILDGHGHGRGRYRLVPDLERASYLEPTVPILPEVTPRSPFDLPYPLASSSLPSPTTPRASIASPSTSRSAAAGGRSFGKNDTASLASPVGLPSRFVPSAEIQSPHTDTPPLPGHFPADAPNQRNVSRGFSPRRTREEQLPLPALFRPTGHYAIPPNLSPLPQGMEESVPRPLSQGSRVANAPTALPTTSSAPVSSSSSHSTSSASRPTAPSEPSARTRTYSSATSVSSLDKDDSGLRDEGSDFEWPRRVARAEIGAESFARDLRSARRKSVKSLGGTRASASHHHEIAEPEETESQDEPDEETEAEEEYDGSVGDVKRGLDDDGLVHALARRTSTMSLRHQLAAFPQIEDHSPVLQLPVHLEGDSEQPQHVNDESLRLPRLQLEGVARMNPAAAAICGAHEQEQRSPVTSADFIVAVVGPRLVGKSTVIRRGLKRSADVPIVLQEDSAGNRVTTSTTSFSISGMRRTIEVLEIDMGLLGYSEDGVVWPDALPQCEGAMLCYDSTDPNSLSSLSLLLKAFWVRGSEVPIMVLACKAAPPDAGPDANATDPNEAAAVCNIYGAGIVTLDGGIDDPQRKTKECFNWLIRQIMDNRGELMRPPSSTSTSPAQNRRGSLRNTAHLAYATTSSSPITSAPPSAPLPEPPASSPRASSPSRNSHSESAVLGLSVVHKAPLDSANTPIRFPTRQAGESQYEAEAHAAVTAMFASVAADEDDTQVMYAPQPSPAAAGAQLPTGKSDGPPTATSTNASKALDSRSPQERASGAQTFQAGVVPYPPAASLERRGSAKPPSFDHFFDCRDLIDKFLFAAVAGNDENFVTLFLIIFRRFARPYDVLEKLVERFDFVTSKMSTDPLLCRFGQMKLCGVLSTWMQNYPGDFVAPATFGLVERFLENLLPSGATWVAHYAFELLPLLTSIARLSDPELGWALPDDGNREPSYGHTPDAVDATHQPAPTSMPRRGSLVSSSDLSSSIALDTRSVSDSQLSGPVSLDTGETSSAGAAQMQRSTSDAGTDGASSSILMRNGIPSSAVLVDLSNAIVEMREQDIATQITRIAWDIFGRMSASQPRDLIRHVLAPRDPHNPEVALRDSTDPVARSINFVNHLASWTATLILVQSKIKARARVVEKLLLVAVALREQENFDSLMGILAGLNSQPIFRLTETMELVTDQLDGDPRVNPHRAIQPDGDKHRLPKKLRSLNRLMAASKSFAAYRLALANSGVSTLPYLGVHLQDLTVANEAKCDTRQGRINWTKMSQMGKSAAVVLDCARVAPKFAVDRMIERCILNATVLDDDRQYTLSYAHQPRQSAKTGARARLREFAKSTF